MRAVSGSFSLKCSISFFGIDRPACQCATAHPDSHAEKRPFKVPVADKGSHLPRFPLNHIPGLEDIETLFRGILKGEFDLLMVESLFVDQEFRNPDEFVVYFRKSRFQRDQRLPFFRNPLFFRNGKGLHETGDDIIPLNTEDEISIDGNILR